MLIVMISCTPECLQQILLTQRQIEQCTINRILDIFGKICVSCNHGHLLILHWVLVSFLIPDTVGYLPQLLPFAAIERYQEHEHPAIEVFHHIVEYTFPVRDPEMEISHYKHMVHEDNIPEIDCEAPRPYLVNQVLVLFLLQAQPCSDDKSSPKGP